MSEIIFTRVARELTNEIDVLGCSSNLGFKPAELPGRGFCPIIKKDVVLNDTGFCMSADCSENTTTDQLLNMGRGRYLELVEELAERLPKLPGHDLPQDVELDYEV